MILIRLNGLENVVHEEVRGQESYSPHCEVHPQDNDAHIAQVDEDRDKPRKCREAACQETKRVQQDVDGHRTASVERTPPDIGRGEIVDKSSQMI